MKDLFSPIGAAINAITNASSLKVAREHIDFLKTQVAALKDEFARLEQENRALEEEVRRVHRDPPQIEPADDLKKWKGAYFQRLPGGGYDDVVYCPKCREAAFYFEGTRQFHCTACHWASAFTRDELAAIIASIPAD